MGVMADDVAKFCARLRPGLVGSLTLYLGDAPLAEELAQEALARAWERLTSRRWPMRGHLQQRGDDQWRLKVFLGRSPDGKRRYLERTVRGTRREAERALARLVVEVDEGRHVAAAQMTVGEVVDRWLALKATTVEPTTVEGYRWIVERYARPEFGARRVSSLRTLELDDWYQRLRAGGGTDG